jgi:hypothetical protein
MRHRHERVHGSYRDGIFWYVVTMSDGGEELYQRAWEAHARAHGWEPPENWVRVIVPPPARTVAEIEKR